MTTSLKQTATLKQEMLVTKLRDVLGRMEIATMLSSDAMVWTDNRGRIQWCNNAFEDILGMTRLDLLGTSLVEVLPLEVDGERLHPAQHPFNLVLTRQSHEVGHYTLVREDGPVIVEIAQAPTSAQDMVSSAVLVMRRTDRQKNPLPEGTINPQKIRQLVEENRTLRAEIDRLNARLNAVEMEEDESIASGYRTKGAFLANMTHELRTPLSAILGYADLLSRDLASNGHTDWVRDVSQIKLASNRLFFMITQLLDLAAIEEDQFSLNIARFSVPDLLKQVEITVSELLAEQNNQLCITCGDGVDEMVTDEGKLRKILLHLLSNAAKFTIQGRIDLEVMAQPEDRLLFAVRDTGIGMTGAQIKRMFEPFTQGDESMTRQYEGSGVGLYICRQFCEKLGGQIDIQSEPGVGTSIQVSFPRVLDEAAAGA